MSSETSTSVVAVVEPPSAASVNAIKAQVDKLYQEKKINQIIYNHAIALITRSDTSLVSQLVDYNRQKAAYDAFFMTYPSHPLNKSNHLTTTTTTNSTADDDQLAEAVADLTLPDPPKLSHPNSVEALKDFVLEELERDWDLFFEKCNCSTNDGKKMSRNERAEKGINVSSLIYGEVGFHSFGLCLWGDLMKLKPGGVFYDLGSGTGRAVIAATYLHDFEKLVGIEILTGLTDASKEIQKRFEADIAPHSVNEHVKKAKMEFYEGSFLELDWSDGDFVFANSTCFDEALMSDIAEQGKKLKDGTYFMTLTKRFYAPHFNLIHSAQYNMSWGKATVNIHQKITPK